MVTVTQKDLLQAGVHFGHLARKWHPKMAPFIFMERQGIHIIDLNKTLVHLEEAATTLQGIARMGRKILFVGTKKQAKHIIETTAQKLTMPYVTERWLGGTLTNFVTIRRLLKKMSSIDKMMKEAAYENMAKKEQLMMVREKAKLNRVLKGLIDVTRLPGALFVVDVNREHIAIKEAQKLGIPIIGFIDTNANPKSVDYPIPSNDDATTSIEIIMEQVRLAIERGLAEREQDKLEQEQLAKSQAEEAAQKETSQKPGKKAKPSAEKKLAASLGKKRPRIQSENTSGTVKTPAKEQRVAAVSAPATEAKATPTKKSPAQSTTAKTASEQPEAVSETAEPAAEQKDSKQ